MSLKSLAQPAHPANAAHQLEGIHQIVTAPAASVPTEIGSWNFLHASFSCTPSTYAPVLMWSSRMAQLPPPLRPSPLLTLINQPWFPGEHTFTLPLRSPFPRAPHALQPTHP